MDNNGFYKYSQLEEYSKYKNGLKTFDDVIEKINTHCVYYDEYENDRGLINDEIIFKKIEFFNELINLNFYYKGFRKFNDDTMLNVRKIIYCNRDFILFDYYIEYCNNYSNYCKYSNTIYAKKLLLYGNKIVNYIQNTTSEIKSTFAINQIIKNCSLQYVIDNNVNDSPTYNDYLNDENYIFFKKMYELLCVYDMDINSYKSIIALMFSKSLYIRETPINELLIKRHKYIIDQKIYGMHKEIFRDYYINIIFKNVKNIADTIITKLNRNSNDFNIQVPIQRNECVQLTDKTYNNIKNKFGLLFYECKKVFRNIVMNDLIVKNYYKYKVTRELRMIINNEPKIFEMLRKMWTIEYNFKNKKYETTINNNTLNNDALNKNTLNNNTLNNNTLNNDTLNNNTLNNNTLNNGNKMSERDRITFNEYIPLVTKIVKKIAPGYVEIYDYEYGKEDDLMDCECKSNNLRVISNLSELVVIYKKIIEKASKIYVANNNL